MLCSLMYSRTVETWKKKATLDCEIKSEHMLLEDEETFSIYPHPLRDLPTERLLKPVHT